MTDPLDLLLCPGCGASVEPAIHPADDDGPVGWSATCPCGYDLSGGNVNDGDPPTLRRIIDGADTGAEWNDVDLGAYTRAVFRALGVS